MPIPAQIAFDKMLASFRQRLVVRHVLRLLVRSWLVAGLLLTVSLLIVVALPWWLFSVNSLLGWVIACGGSIAGAVLYALSKRTSLPTIQETAMAAESRLDTSNGLITSAIATSGIFDTEVTARAENELSDAIQEPAPALFSLQQVIVAPMLTVVLALILVVLSGLESKTNAIAEVHEVVDSPVIESSWNAMDTGIERTQADQLALAKAKGLEAKSETLHDNADTIRKAKSKTEAQAALDNARKGLPENVSKDVLPEIIAEDKAGRDEIANKIESIADEVSAAAAKLRQDGGSKGTLDSGGDVTAEPDETPDNLVAMPKFESTLVTMSPFVGMTPARRELAARAVKALEETK